MLGSGHATNKIASPNNDRNLNTHSPNFTDLRSDSRGDGGIDAETAGPCAAAGATAFVAGTAVFGEDGALCGSARALWIEPKGD